MTPFAAPDSGDLCPLEELTRAETIESVRKAVLSLPAKYREVVVLCELQDISYGETAEILGCAIGTVVPGSTGRGRFCLRNFGRWGSLKQRIRRL